MEERDSVKNNEEKLEKAVVIVGSKQVIALKTKYSKHTATKKNTKL